jgi:hypothetical protein
MKRTMVLIVALMASVAVGASAQVKVKPGSAPGKQGPGPGAGTLGPTKLSGTAPKTGKRTSGNPPATAPMPAAAKPPATSGQ